jgi:hypothetical protein
MKAVNAERTAMLDQKPISEGPDMNEEATLSTIYDLTKKIGAPGVLGVKMHPNTCRYLRGVGYVQRDSAGGIPSNDDKDIYTFRGKRVTLSARVKEDTFELVLTK